MPTFVRSWKFEICLFFFPKKIHSAESFIMYVDV